MLPIVQINEKIENRITKIKSISLNAIIIILFSLIFIQFLKNYLYQRYYHLKTFRQWGKKLDPHLCHQRVPNLKE